MGSQSSANLAATTILDKHWGQDTSAALQKVEEVLRKADHEFLGGYSMRYSYTVDLAMILKQVMVDSRYKTPPTSGHGFTDRTIMKKASRLVKFADAAYFGSKSEISKRVEHLTTGHVKFLWSSMFISCPNFFIADDPLSNDLVLSIRGSPSHQNPLLNCVGSTPQDFLQGRAHGEMHKKAEQLVANSHKVVVDLLNKEPGKRLSITGYGIGGSIATLAALDFMYGPHKGLVDPNLVQCYAFGAPPVFSSPTTLPQTVVSSVYSFVNNTDCVPRASVGSLGKLIRAVKHVDKLEMNNDQRIEFISEKNSSNTKIADFIEPPAGDHGNLDSLFGVGTLIVLCKGSNRKTYCEKAAPKLLDRILLQPNMLAEHSMHGPVGYEAAVTQACELMEKERPCAGCV